MRVKLALASGALKGLEVLSVGIDHLKVAVVLSERSMTATLAKLSDEAQYVVEFWRGSSMRMR